MAEEKTLTEEATFEDGKQVEDYLGELSEVEQTLAIEPELSPEATAHMEDVAQPPVRNKPEKKTETKKPQPPPATPKSTPTAPQPVASQPAATQATTIATTQDSINMKMQTPPPTLKPEPTPKEVKPTQEAPPQANQSPPPVQAQQQVMGVDAFIETMSIQAGQQKYQEVKSNAYRNINALFQGDLVLVPTQQLQQLQQQQQTPPQPVPQPEVSKEPEVQLPSQVNVIEQVKTLDAVLKDPAISLITKNAIKKKQCELLGIPYEEVPEPSPAPVSPVNPKLANDGKKEKPKKKPLQLKEKAMIGAVGTAVVVLVILTIGYLIH